VTGKLRFYENSTYLWERYFTENLLTRCSKTAWNDQYDSFNKIVFGYRGMVYARQNGLWTGERSIVAGGAALNSSIRVKQFPRNLLT
jgi:hypothetical protein